MTAPEATDGPGTTGGPASGRPATSGKPEASGKPGATGGPEATAGPDATGGPARSGGVDVAGGTDDLVPPDEIGGTAAETDAGEERASALLGLVMVVAGIVVLVDAAGLRGGGGPVGPAAAPMLIGVLLGVLGIGLAVQSRGGFRTLAALVERPARWGRLAALIAALIAFAVLLPFAGWTLCATALFTAAALLLGAPNPVRTAAYGFALAGTVFLIFDGLIGLILPAGPWGF